MTNRETAQAIDSQLTHLISLVSGPLYSEEFGETERASVRVYVSMAIGIMAGFAPESASVAFTFAQALTEADTQDEFASIQRAVFEGAFAHLNTALYS